MTVDRGSPGWCHCVRSMHETAQTARVCSTLHLQRSTYKPFCGSCRVWCDSIFPSGAAVSRSCILNSPLGEARRKHSLFLLRRKAKHTSRSNDDIVKCATCLLIRFVEWNVLTPFDFLIVQLGRGSPLWIPDCPPIWFIDLVIVVAFADEYFKNSLGRMCSAKSYESNDTVLAKCINIVFPRCENDSGFVLTDYLQRDHTLHQHFNCTFPSSSTERRYIWKCCKEILLNVKWIKWLMIKWIISCWRFMFSFRITVSTTRHSQKISINEKKLNLVISLFCYTFAYERESKNVQVKLFSQDCFRETFSSADYFWVKHCL